MDISIIVPAYNEEKYIEAALKSARNQKTNLKYELIVADCKSFDRTVKIAKKYADEIVVSPKRDVAAARNAGAAIAKGKILVFIDSDTRILPDYLEIIYKKFKKTPHLAGLSASFKFSKQSPKLIFAEEVTNGYLLMRSQIGRATLPGFNTCVLKNKFKKIGGFKSGLLEDVQLSRDLNLLGRTEYLFEKKVITSSRKLERWGVLGTLRYYFELGLVENNIDLPFKEVDKIKEKVLEKAMKYKGRKHVR